MNAITMPKDIHDWIAIFGLLCAVAMAFITGEIKAELEAHNYKDHSHPSMLLRQQEIEAKVEAVRQDVAYNRERGDLIQKQNNAAHARQEELLKSILRAVEASRAQP